MTPLDVIMSLSDPFPATGCRVWRGPTSPDGEPVARIRGRVLPVKRYLNANRFRRERQHPVFENRCGNRLCITAAHTKAVAWQPFTEVAG